MRIALACFVLGVVLMVGFDAPVTRVLGVGLLVAFVVCGVFALASPERLAQEEDEG
jgi:hypothetical protein